MTDSIEEFLTSDVGRKMVEEVARKALGYYALPMITLAPESPQTREMARRVIEAFLRMAMDDTCSTCGGGEWSVPPEAEWQRCPNPDCKDGKVPPALYTQEQVDLYVADTVRPMRKEHRAQVVAEIVEDLRGAPNNDAGLRRAADRIERRERERCAGS